jgi:hypothetical protein
MRTPAIQKKCCATAQVNLLVCHGPVQTKFKLHNLKQHHDGKYNDSMSIQVYTYGMYSGHGEATRATPEASQGRCRRCSLSSGRRPASSCGDNCDDCEDDEREFRCAAGDRDLAFVTSLTCLDALRLLAVPTGCIAVVPVVFDIGKGTGVAGFDVTIPPAASTASAASIRESPASLQHDYKFYNRDEARTLQ